MAATASTHGSFDKRPVPDALARARVSVGLDVDVNPENVLEGSQSQKRADASASPLVYRWPPVSLAEERELAGAYEALTGRRAWASVQRPLIVARRVHGPDTIALLRELYAAYGITDLLRRLLAHAPRSGAHSDYALPIAAPSSTARVHPETSLALPAPGPRSAPMPQRRGPSDADTPELPRTRLPAPKPIDAPWDQAELADTFGEVSVPVHAGAPVEPTSTQRQDQNPSHPDAAVLFWDEAFGSVGLSPTARALAR